MIDASNLSQGRGRKKYQGEGTYTRTSGCLICTSIREGDRRPCTEDAFSRATSKRITAFGISFVCIM